MAIYRVTTRWTGFQGAPGYSNFHFHELSGSPGPEDGRNRVVAFFNEVRTLLPTDVGFLTEGEVTIIDETTGMIEGYETVSENPPPGNGLATGGYSAASGAVVTWNTAGVRNGRRVRGRTFLVPLGGNAYQDDGTLTTNAIDTINDAAAELVGVGFDSGFSIFSRPGSSGAGGVYPVNGWRVPDMAAVLRSRRD